MVRQNLALALPHLSDKERNIIEKKFYSHMCDLYLEMIKTLSISRKEIEKRYVFTNMEVYHQLEKKEMKYLHWMVNIFMKNFSWNQWNLF